MTGWDPVWVRDGDRVVVVGCGGACSRVLRGADAAVWEWWADDGDLNAAVCRAAECWRVDPVELRRRHAAVLRELTPASSTASKEKG